MARVCVIRQSNFPHDPRVHREVDALVEAGHEVEVLCMAERGKPRFEQDGALTIRRLPLRHRRGGFARYLFEYGLFFLMAMLVSGALHVRRRYALVQVNTLPDFLVFSAIIPKAFGARVLLDLHECMPEFYATKFRKASSHPLVRLVSWLEQRSIAFADAAVTCTEQMRQTFISRGAAADKITVVLNGADESAFDPSKYSPHQRSNDRFVLISHGTIEERYGLDTIIRAVALLRQDIPGLSLRLYGDGSYVPYLRRLTTDLAVEDRVQFSDGFAPFPELVEAIATSDAGVVAMKRDSFRDLTLCNKMYDFIAMRKPVISSRTRSVVDYYGESCFLMFDSDDPHGLAHAIRRLYEDPDLADQLVAQAVRTNEPYRWRHQKRIYLGVLARFVGDHGAEGRLFGESNAVASAIEPEQTH
jgi:glycosyltransferase involved in cell wall biosynthesis